MKRRLSWFLMGLVCLVSAACGSGGGAGEAPEVLSVDTASAVPEGGDVPVEARQPRPQVREHRLEAAPEDRTVAQRIDDASHEARITQALLETGDLRPFVLDVHVVEGHAVLRGHLETTAQRELAVRIASRVKGTRSVSTDITVAEEEDEITSPTPR